MGQYTRVTADHWTDRGEAVANDKRRGRLIIWEGIPREIGDVTVVHRGQNQSFAVWRGSPRPHPQRVSPPCDKYSTCGGCPLMHVNSAGQKTAKQALVKDALFQEGLVDVELGEWFDSPDGHEGYRYVVKLGLGLSNENKVKIGAWGRRNRRIVPIPHCLAAAPVLRDVMRVVAHYVIDSEIQPYDPRTKRGTLRCIVLRASRFSKEVMVTLIAGRKDNALEDLAEEIELGSPSVVGVWQHMNQTDGNAIFDPDEEGNIRLKRLAGKPAIEEKLNGITYKVGPAEFFQTNPSVAELLYQHTLKRLQPTKEDAVIDCYSGVGGFALQVGGKAGFTIGIEESFNSVRRARQVARAQRIQAEFISGRVEDELEKLHSRLRSLPPLVVVNPARRGLEPDVVERIMSLHPKRIAYVSCNPRALARDLALFRAQNMNIGKIDLFDMFPNTPHVECLAILETKDVHVNVTRPPRRKRVRTSPKT